MAYTETSSRGSSTVRRVYSGEDPNKRFSRFFGVGSRAVKLSDAMKSGEF